ncbi:MAG: hypothetical protein ACQER4_07705, partial [Bacteroidota bacterium]
MTRILLITTLLTLSLTIHAAAQMDSVADSVRHFEALMQTTDDPGEVERARNWLGQYYRGKVSRDESDVPEYQLPDLLRLE